MSLFCGANSLLGKPRKPADCGNKRDVEFFPRKLTANLHLKMLGFTWKCPLGKGKPSTTTSKFWVPAVSFRGGGVFCKNRGFSPAEMSGCFGYFSSFLLWNIVKYLYRLFVQARWNRHVQLSGLSRQKILSSTCKDLDFILQEGLPDKQRSTAVQSMVRYQYTWSVYWLHVIHKSFGTSVVTSGDFLKFKFAKNLVILIN